MTAELAHAPLIDLLAALPPDRLAALRAELGEEHWAALDDPWRLTARAEQLPPPGAWRLWLILAGRGFGKTRAGAEWIDRLAMAHPRARIALVGATMNDVRQVMVEGESGLLNLPGPGRRPAWHPSLRRLIWPNGALATCYSAAEPESLRGPQHHFAWCDEIARWDSEGPGRAVAAWDNLMLGLRLGRDPRVLATTTPRAVPLVRRLLDEPGAVISRGRTLANRMHLPPAFLAAMETTYGGTLLARQELDGELIEDVPGALWTRAMLEAARTGADAIDDGAIARVVIGVDPPASATGDACGIIIAARLTDGRAAILADESVEQASPERWAAAVADAQRRWRADRVIAEANNGGAMVESVLRAAEAELPLTLVHARRSKSGRAEPVATLYERGRVIHARAMPRLEDELCGMVSGGGYAGPGRSPDRADAAIWALTALMLGASGGEPQVREL